MSYIRTAPFPACEAAALHLRESSCTCRLSEAAVKSLHISIHTESPIGNLEGAGKAERRAKDLHKQAVVIHERNSPFAIDWWCWYLGHDSSPSAESNQTESRPFGEITSWQLKEPKMEAPWTVVWIQVLITAITEATVPVLGGNWTAGAGRAEKAESRQGGSGMWGMQLRQTESPTLLCLMKPMLPAFPGAREQIRQREAQSTDVIDREGFSSSPWTAWSESAGPVARPVGVFAHKSDRVNGEQRGCGMKLIYTHTVNMAS